MFQLVYLSKALDPVSDAQLGSILATSRKNNARDGVTGLLVAGPRRFLQALEGPDQIVLDTYARIKADPRHCGFVLLTGRGIEAPGFGGWAMASEESVGLDDEGTLPQVVGALTASLSDKSLRARFMGFAESHARAA